MMYRVEPSNERNLFGDDLFALIDVLGESFFDAYDDHEVLSGVWQELPGVVEGDISKINASIISARLHLSQTLEPMFEYLSQYGELLPFSIEGQRYWFFNCLNKADQATSINTKRSKYGDLTALDFPSQGASGRDIWISQVDNYTRLYCREAFIDVCQKHKVSGLTFEPQSMWF